VKRVRPWLGVIAAALLASVGLVVGLAIRPGDAGAAAEAYALFLGAIGLSLLVKRTSRTFAPPTESQLAKLVARPPRKDVRLPELVRIERELEMATQSAFDTHYRLRPILRELAATRLARSAVELDQPASRAEALLGPEAWQLVRPDVAPPADHYAAGARLATVAHALDALESLP
jgi:hypothetical protein